MQGLKVALFTQLFTTFGVQFLVPTERIVMDEEHLEFSQNMFDCVLSSFSLHWVNNLPGKPREEA